MKASLVIKLRFGEQNTGEERKCGAGNQGKIVRSDRSYIADLDIAAAAFLISVFFASTLFVKDLISVAKIRRREQYITDTFRCHTQVQQIGVMEIVRERYHSRVCEK